MSGFLIPSSAIIVLVALSAVSGFLTSTDIVVERSYYPSIATEVKVVRRLFTAPTFEVRLESLDRGDGVTLKAYVWMPEGNIVEVWKGGAAGPVVEMSMEAFSKTFKAWADYVRERRASPTGLRVGVTLIASILKDDGLYTLVTVVPVPVDLGAGYSVVIDIHKKPIKVMDMKELKSEALSVIRRAKARLAGSGLAVTSYEPLPPPIIGSCLPPAPWGGPDLWLVCEEWHLEGGPWYAAFDVPIPLVAAVIKSTAYNKISSVYLNELVVAKEETNLRVGITAVAGITTSSVSGGVTYEVAGIEWEASSSEWANLDYGRFFTPGEDFSKPSILYVGFRGDISIAPYRLYTCIYPLGWCWPHDEWANITYARPANNGPLNNDTAVYGSVSLDDYGNPVLRQYADMIVYGWLDYSDSRTASDELRVTNLLIKNELNTVPILAGGFNVLSLLISDELGPLAPLMAVSIGVTAEEIRTDVTYLLCAVDLKEEATVVWRYARSPVLYDYEGEQHEIGLVYVEVS